MTVHLTVKSSNKKTGPIPVSTSSEDTCPASCPLKGKGICYAKYGPLGLHWKKVSDGDRGTDWKEFCDKIKYVVKAGQIWRHNQAGDLPHEEGEIDAEKLCQLVEANRGRKGFTYTHHRGARNMGLVWMANRSGFTINLSADSLFEVDTLVKLDAGPVVTVLPEDHDRKPFKTEGGNTVVVCPAVKKESMTCEKCQLCADPDRSLVVGFPVHGTGKGKYEAC